MASSKVKAAKPDKKAVKDGRVTKSSQTPKTKGTETAKKVAAKISRRDVSSSASESDSESDVTSSSSESSASESEAEIKPTKTKAPLKANGSRKDDTSSASDDSSDSSSKGVAIDAKVKPTSTNGAPKATAKADNDSSSASDSESSSDESSDDKPSAPINAKAAAEDSSSASDSESESESESDDDTAKKAAAIKPVNGAPADVEAGSSSSDSSESSDESSASESDDEEAAPAKKRKAEVEETPVPKKTKVEEPSNDTRITNLFVGSLSWNVDEEWLMREFEQFGEISSCRVITERDSGKSKGFGYVTFATHEAAARALEEKQGALIDNRAVNLDWSTPRDDSAPKAKFQDRARKFGDKESPPSATLFLGNLSFEITPEDVRENFEQYGSIARISIPTDRDTGAVKGFGYVDFGSVEEATEAKNNLTGQYIKGRPLRLDFGKPRDDNGGFGGGRGGFGGRGGRGGGRGGARGGRGGRGDRGGFQKTYSTNRGGMGEFKGTKVSFD